MIFAFARERGYVVVSEDTHFGELLARQRAAAAWLLSVIPRVRDELAAGAVVVVGRDRIRVRALPLLPPLPEQRDK